ncbi:hypothetical protein LCGC14_2686080, partial [marine sediment metagenome]
MRVLMVISDLRVGGVETMAVSLAKGLVEAGHELAVASIKQADVLAEAFVSAGAALHRRIARFRFDPAGMLRMRLLIRRFAPDVLIIAGALDGASGFVLSILMSRAMNRSFTNVLFGAFGAATETGTDAVAAGLTVRSISVEDAAAQLAYAREVIVVPG